jgi:HEPN domain-containing protein
MDVQRHIDFWRAGAQEDWDVGAGLVRDGKTRHGLFFVHLALEKALKAIVSRKTGEVPPRIHNLVKLAEMAGLELDKKSANVLSDMNRFQIQGRYPDMLPPPPTKKQADSYVRRAQEAFRCLIQA